MGYCYKIKIWWWNKEGAALVKENQLMFYRKDIRSARKDADVGKHEFVQAWENG